MKRYQVYYQDPEFTGATCMVYHVALTEGHACYDFVSRGYSPIRIVCMGRA